MRHALLAVLLASAASCARHAPTAACAPPAATPGPTHLVPFSDCGVWSGCIEVQGRAWLVGGPPGLCARARSALAATGFIGLGIGRETGDGATWEYASPACNRSMITRFPPPPCPASVPPCEGGPIPWSRPPR